jgi:hypothetical protein
VNVQPVLLLLGAGFVVVNARVILQYVRYLRRRSHALLVWPAPKPPQYTLSLAIGVALGMLVFYKIVFIHRQAFGETMMFIYYAYLLPLSRRIGRGFYGTASGPIRRSSRTTRSAASAGGRANTR